MKNIKGSAQIFKLASRFPSCCLVVVAVWQIGHTTAYTVKEVTPVLNIGSGPMWNIETKSMYVVDAEKHSIYRYQPDINEFVGVMVDGLDALQFLVPVSGESTPTFVVDNNVKVSVLSWDGKITTSIKAAYDLNLTIDAQYEYVACAKGDSRGRLWIGVSKVSTGDIRQGKLYMINQNGVANMMLDNIDAPDSIAWSPLNTRIFWLNIDSRKIFSRMFNTANGKMSIDNEVVLDFAAKKLAGSPSDMTVDASGNLWVACMDTSHVLKIDAKSGDTLLQVDIPGAESITHVAFGGDNLQDLYVTGKKTNLFRVTDTSSAGLNTNAVILPPP